MVNTLGYNAEFPAWEATHFATHGETALFYLDFVNFAIASNFS